ncbi:MAG TPA: hypothetical protein VFY77_07855 [Nitrososphaeraceae archaeon]|nr:hypothetical protein [Nitrososphaeraceae archaeon]
MQKSKGDTIFLKLWKNIKYGFRIQKATTGWNNKATEVPNFLSDRYSSKTFLLKKIISYAFAGFSIIYIGYLLINIVNNYPPREIGITP